MKNYSTHHIHVQCVSNLKKSHLPKYWLRIKHGLCIFFFFLFLSTRKCMKIVISSLEKSDISYLEVPVFRYIEFSSYTSRDKIHGCTDNKPKLKKKGTSCWNCCQVKKAFFTIDTNIHIINICFMYNTCLQIYTVALLKCLIFYLFINTSYDIKFFVKKTF